MALHGDNEIDSLLAMMGSPVQTQTPTSITSSTKPPTGNGDDKRSKQKTKKRKKKKGHKTKEGDASSRRNKSNSKNHKTKSFADTRLSQNCFEWPCTNNGQRCLHLGSGLLDNFEKYVWSSSEGENNNGCYGASACQSCGKAAVNFELCLSSSWEGGVNNNNASSSSIADCFSLDILSIAKIIVATRNARCLIGEYYATSKSNQEGDTSQMRGHELSKNVLLPPLKSTLTSSDMISNNLDRFVGSALASLRSMQNSQPQMKSRPALNGGMQEVSISANDIQLLQEKVSALINDVQGYKEAMNNACSPNKAARKDVAIDLVEKRLAAIASCDAVYYRCYYAAVVSCHSSDNTRGNSDVAALIPHPPTYFSCPGLAWDVHDAGVESLRVFLGETNNGDLDDLAAPLDDSTRNNLLKSWGLDERLTPATSYAKFGNPLLSLWQSRFLETIRHVWATRYSAAKSPLALREASNNSTKDTTNGAHDDMHGNSLESLLKMHDTEALSPAMAQWRDSVRDYPANFYAYATPTKEALEAISNCFGSLEIGQIVEAGAGTGYWSTLLRSHLKRTERKPERLGKDEMLPKEVPLVVPYDIAPPSTAINYGDGNDRAAFSNEYHGNIPTFMDVHQANTFSQAFSTSATSANNAALLLCYPPPGSDMAHRAVSAHISNGGRTVMHIGEWQGLTGDAAFEALLAQQFSCEKKEVIHLPMWGTDTTYLTIWKKKDSDDQDTTQRIAGTNSFSPALGYCSVEQCFNHARRRCRYVRSLQYCSLECYGKHSSRRRAVLALHMICSRTASGDESMVYANERHFMSLDDITGLAGRSVESGERSRKRRKKKRR